MTEDTPFSAHPVCVWLLSLAMLIGLTIRLSAVQVRGVNPDEGQHMADGQLILAGKIPLVDYSSREPVYAWVLAMAQKHLGTNVVATRCALAVVSVLTGVLLFLAGLKLFDARVACLAACAYWLSPFSIMNSTTVLSEPLAVFLAVLSIYALAVAQAQERMPTSLGLMLLVGVVQAAAYYIRQSAIALPLVTHLFLALAHWRRPRAFAALFCLYLLGYALVCAAVIGYLASHSSLAALWPTLANPLALVSTRVGNVLRLVSDVEQAAEAASPRFRMPDQLWVSTKDYVTNSINFNLFLLVGLTASGLAWARSWRTQKPPAGFEPAGGSKSDSPPGRSLILLYLWFGCFAAAYGYQLAQRGFFYHYFEEFLPPLLLAGSFAMIYYWPKAELRRNYAAVVLWVIVYAAAFLAVRRPSIKAFALASAVTCGLTLLWPRLSGSKLAFCSVSLILASAAFSLSLVTTYPQVFKGLWPLSSVSDVAAHVRVTSSEDDEVLSGALIWSVSADRKPFLNITHPTLYRTRMTPQFAKEFENALRQKPPRFVMLDGYTDEVFVKQVPGMAQILSESYRVEKTVEGARQPAVLYGLKPAGGGS